MASPFRSYSSFFRELQGESPETGGLTPLGRPETGGGLQYDPGEAQQPQTPPSPRTPTFAPFGEEERPATFSGYTGPEPQPAPTRPLSAAVGGARSQTTRAAPQGAGGTRSPYTSNYAPSGGGGAEAARPPTGGPLTYQPQTPETGGPLTYQPPVTGGPLIQEPTQAPAPQTQTFQPTQPIQPAPSSYQLVGYEPPQATQDLYSQLMAPITGDLQRGYGALGEAQQEFYGQLPDARTWESIGGPALMERALAGDVQAEEELRGALGAAYTGPGGLDLEAIQEIYGIGSSLSPYAAGGLSTMAGAGSLLEGMTPGLTPGMRREEARRLLSDEDYQAYARQTGRDISRLGGTTRAEAVRSNEEAQRIAESEEALGGAARGSLEGRRGEIAEGLSGRVDEARQAQQDLEAAYAEYQASGELDPLKRYGIDPAAFESEYSDLDREAQAAKAQIMDDPRFAKVADVPLMQLGVSGKGRQKLDFPQEWYNANRSNYTAAEMAEVKKLARQRQKELDDAGFARAQPYTTYNPEGGKYSGVENIYFGGEDYFDPADPGNYIQFDAGEYATRHNIATGEERESYNKIQDLLGSTDQLQTATPHQAAKVVADTEKYLDDMEAQYEAAMGKQKKTAQDFDNMRQGMRDAYRDAKREDKYQKVGAVVGAIVGTVVGGQTVLGAGVGSQIGKGLA